MFFHESKLDVYALQTAARVHEKKNWNSVIKRDGVLKAIQFQITDNQIHVNAMAYSKNTSTKLLFGLATGFDTFFNFGIRSSAQLISRHANILFTRDSIDIYIKQNFMREYRLHNLLDPQEQIIKNLTRIKVQNSNCSYQMSCDRYISQIEKTKNY